MKLPNRKEIRDFITRLFTFDFLSFDSSQLQNNALEINLIERFWYKKKYIYAPNGARNFIDDMYMGIMPFTHMTPRQPATFRVTLDPPNQAIERMIAQALSERGYGGSRLEESVCEFIRMAALGLFSNGREIYEIIDTRDPQGNLQSFDIRSIRMETVIKFFGNYYQFIPKSRSRMYGHEKAQIIKISQKRIFVVKFPKELGSRRSLYKMIKRLTELGQEIMPEFQTSVMKANKNIGFNFERYIESKDLESASITKKFGWNKGTTLEKKALEHYFLRRYLNSKRAQIIVRDHILACINEIINGENLNLGSQIILSGIPTLDTIEENERRLNECGVNLKDLVNATKLS